ncbi:Ribosomal RNA small subunit methyltransferase E [Thalassocella blandensis]|nr:Ribosomal RNA small subunit methyltransferase E [Thalassocella blandensis]
MRVPRVYTTQNIQTGQELALEAGPSHHLIKVLRMSEGRELLVFNGNGKEYSAVIHSATKKVATITINKETDIARQSPLDIELAIGLSKGDRFEWVLQKATELGVTRITPLLTERTEIKLSSERLEKKITSWENIIIGACEQSQRNILPALSPPMHLSDFLSHSQAQLKFILHHRSEAGLSDIKKPDSVALIIGPEGGLSETEIDLALKHSCSPLTLGPRVMRTETAPIAALSVFQYLWGDLADFT